MIRNANFHGDYILISTLNLCVKQAAGGVVKTTKCPEPLKKTPEKLEFLRTMYN